MSEQTLSEALKSHSRQTHDSVDNLVMSAKPFESLENYGKFLQAQYEFHKTVKSVYNNPHLMTVFANLPALSRFERVVDDMADLNVVPFANAPVAPTFSDDEAIGWFYCVEGSNVGAAILYKEAGKINLNDTHGARHLAAHEEGRMPHWRDTKAKINALELNAEQKMAALKGSDDAFAYFKKVIRAIYDLPAA